MGIVLFPKAFIISSKKNMKYLKHIALAILFGAILSVSAYADGKPSGGDPGNGGPAFGSTTYGLSDSCWKVFLSEISPADAAKLAADQATISGNETQINALNQQIGALLKNATGKRDSATRAQINALEAQIDPLQRANGAAQMNIDSVLRANGSVFQTVEENCGRHERGGGGPDTGKGHGNPIPPDHGTRLHFGLSDSCWNIFLTQISASDAAGLAADQKIIADNQTQIDSLIKQLRSIKGNLKDSTVRAEMKALLMQINTLEKASNAAQKDYGTIIKNNMTALQAVRQGCGRPIHKGGAGDPTNGLQIGAIVPNPAPVGSTANLTITLAADEPVTITIGSAIAMGAPAKQIFNGTLTAGTHTQSLDLTGLKAGVYMVTVQAGNDMAMTKLVIQ
jgi:hypothetical protein